MGVAVEHNFNGDFVSDFSDMLDATDFPSALILGVKEVAIGELLKKVVVFELVCILSQHLRFFSLAKI